ncbi:hypothetical protein OH76DRAFT_1413123 [Lentinus brumalis]|uniref:BTB domain-containing protein n=1 Tax=Lentinus brumalis TaxID=2498619 RepID=A0A371CIV8_9APHY|nr:hypothetical protein OH76DRAFT_1413123 [Polyporus brumalis]
MDIRQDPFDLHRSPSSSQHRVSFAESVQPSLLAPRVRAVGPAPQQAINLRVRNEAPANSAAGVRVPVPSASTSQSSTTYMRVPAPVAPSRCKVVHVTGPSAERHVEPLAVHTVFPPRNARSAEFWYPDGNIIISTGGTYFKLLLSRLSRHCGYFERIANDRARTMVGGQRVVEVRDLELQDFYTFLRYLEIPMEHCVKEAPIEAALSLLRASRVLSCKAIGKLAEARLLGPWSSAAVPAVRDELAGRPYREALRMLELAQDISAPLARKQALYALLTDDQFWTDVASRRAQVAISDADLLLLYRARAAMQEKWRVHVLTPPKACANCGCISDEGARAVLWSGQMAKYTGTEVRDPVRSVEGVRTAVKGLATWCGACVDERTHASGEARDRWWRELDELLGIVVLEAHT